MARAGTGLVALMILISIGLYIAAAVTRHWGKTDDGTNRNIDIWDRGDIDGEQFCDLDDNSRACRGFEVTRGFVVLGILVSIIALAALNWAARFAAFLLFLAGSCGIICVVIFRELVLEEINNSGVSSEVYWSWGLAVAATAINFISGLLTCFAAGDRNYA